MGYIDNIHEWEKSVVHLLNFDGWELEHTGNGMEYYDAIGKTPKGYDCVVEMKFRDKYYYDKMIEKDKLDRLLSLGVVALYFVADPRGNYMFWLNYIKLPEVKQMYCPATTMWSKSKIQKDCYLLPESLASIININE